jgi:hypothetical protein
MEHESHHHSEGSDHHQPGGSKVSHLPGLEGFFDTYLHLKAPFQLPAKAKEFIVKYGPWISLVLLIIAAVTVIPLLVLALGLSVIALPFQAAAGSIHTTGVGYLHLLISLAAMVLDGIAIPGLLKRKLSGWRLLYYASLLSALGSLISLDIVSLIVGLIVSMYILFQIREYYK